jgi:hypothetical protein
MKIIFVHGRAQGEFEEQALKQTWIDTLNEGLKKSNLTLPADITIEFPYYGKLLPSLIEKTRDLEPMDVITRSGTQQIDESAQIAFMEAYYGEIATKLAVSNEEKAELRSIQAKSRGILNWEVVQKLFAFLDTKKIVGDSAIRLSTFDVFMYLTNLKIKSEINQLVEKCFDDKPCVVVGHSLGSIVSYIVLKNNPQFKVKKYITIGSPLGVTAIREHLEPPLRMPECVDKNGGWFNAFDERDFVSLHPLDRVHFNIIPPIENKNNVDNHTPNRHGIIGYLNDVDVAKRIYDAMVS